MTDRDWTSALPGPLDGPTIWRVDLALESEARKRCRSILSREEQSRADRFHRPEDRNRFVASHAALRTILAAALGAEPASLAFDTEDSGKPVLAGGMRGRLRFNLSHSGGWALIGLSSTARIGVDVEAARPLPDALRIAQSHFAPLEVAALARLPADAIMDTFFACWTRKEAFVKGLGVGLSLPLDRFTVSIPPEPAALIDINGDGAAGRRWTLLHLEVATGHVGAAAIEEAGVTCHLRSLTPDWPDMDA